MSTDAIEQAVSALEAANQALTTAVQTSNSASVDATSAANAAAASADAATTAANTATTSANAATASANSATTAANAAADAANQASANLDSSKSLVPAADKIPQADSFGKIATNWLNSEVPRTADLSNTADSAKGSGMSGHNDSLAYASGTVGKAIKDRAISVDLANSSDPAKGATLSGYDGGTVADVLNTVKPLADYAALRAYTGPASIVRITADGVAGYFKYDPSDTTSADNGVTIIVDGSGRRLKRLFDGYYNALWFGVKGDGVTLDNTNIQKAIDTIEALGGGVLYFPPGYYPAYDLKPGSNVTILGSGHGATKFIIPVGDVTHNSIFYHVDQLAPKTNFSIIGCGFKGRWEDANSLVGNGLITLKYIDCLTIRKCSIESSRAFALNINECSRVRIEKNILEKANRDMIAVWGSPDVEITDNILRHNNDDGISVNWETAGTTIVRSRIIISRNILEDTGPIRTQAPKGVEITDNIIARPRGSGIMLGIVNTSKSDISSGMCNIVSNNIITDVMERNWFETGDQVGSVNSRVYINIRSIAAQAGGEPVIPGEVNPATGMVHAPYGFFYTKGNLNTGVGPVRIPDSTSVFRNTCKRTLPAVSKYSDWGFGPAFAGVHGWVDYAVSDAVLRSAGSIVRLPQRNLYIEDNIFHAGRYGVVFDLETGVANANFLAKRVFVRRNDILDVDTYGIGFINDDTFHQDIVVDGNSINCDPYFLSTNRGTQGSWLIQSAPYALKMDGVQGARISRNAVRNAGVAISNVGASAYQSLEGNTLLADAAATGFSTSNKGVGTIPTIGRGEHWWLQFEDSDPTSADYGKSLGANIRNTSGAPTSGKWLTGMRVSERASGESGSVGSKYIVAEYSRTTNGSGNVLGTDWIALRCPTGN